MCGGQSYPQSQFFFHRLGLLTTSSIHCGRNGQIWFILDTLEENWDWYQRMISTSTSSSSNDRLEEKNH
ncbi:hypothetical protein Pmani_011962 [Petrolisthes manimaculis]|uniref:Uncharacterized protein n=1 Tax=Petrolisthes manimaculis TaxID=1843537 RepID=A0AAE1PY75_9EUCA|nr:hypothetical protein Pmani_011962 [Petrolisthes manimaculis]